MAYVPELEHGEELELQTSFLMDKNNPFYFAVSDRAIYWPARKAFAVSDATCFKRIRNGEVSEVCVRRLPPYTMWVLAAFMLLVGLAMSVMMYGPLVRQEPGRHQVSGWPVAIAVGGILLPIASKGRVGLEIRTLNKTFRWKPPLVVDKASKEKILTTLNEITQACERSGLRVTRN